MSLPCIQSVVRDPISTAGNISPRFLRSVDVFSSEFIEKIVESIFPRYYIYVHIIIIILL